MKTKLTILLLVLGLASWDALTGTDVSDQQATKQVKTMEIDGAPIPR
jgi:hypothetical protein